MTLFCKHPGTPSLYSYIISRHLIDLNSILSESEPQLAYEVKENENLVVTNTYFATPIDTLTRDVLDAAKARFEADDLALVERVAGLEIADKLIKFYEDFEKMDWRKTTTDKVNTLRERITHSYRLNSHSGNELPSPSMQVYFKAFSKKKFEKVFKHQTAQNTEGSFGYSPPSSALSEYNPKIIVTEQAIRERLASKNTARRCGQSS